MSKPNLAHEPTPIAPTEVAGFIDAEMRAVNAFMETDFAKQRLKTEVQREAFLQLVMTPFEAWTLDEACYRVATILDLLENHGARLERRRQAAERAVVVEAFDRACNAAGKAAREARS